MRVHAERFDVEILQAGADLADQMRVHAERFDVEILQAQAVTSVKGSGQHKLITTETGDEYCAAAVLLAPGSRYRRLNVPGEEDLIGAGIHFCATCDGPFYKGQEMVVVGGGNSGIEEGLFLTKFASKITVLEVRDRLGASQILQEKVAEHPDMIEVRLNTTVQEFKGDGHLESVVIKDLKTDQVEELYPGAAFIFIGLDPNTGFVKDDVELDRWGFLTTENMQTSVEGVFAAGDARAGSTKQVASAVGEGATAALMIRNYLERWQSNRGYKGGD